MANLFQETGGPMLSHWLRIIILTQLFVVSFDLPVCIRCENFNRVQRQGCAQDYTQCGDCLMNFIKDPDDPRFCYTLEILSHANNEITQEINSEVNLACTFNALVTCNWRKNSKVIKNIGPEFNRQWSAGRGNNTDDCSLIINHLSVADVGSWVCTSMASSKFNELSSGPTQLNIKPTLIKSPASYYEVEEGSSVTLPCVFDHKVACYWMKNGRPMSSNDNYQFTTNTADCSLTIVRATTVDSGEWKCTAPGTSNRDSVSSQPTTLSATKAKIHESPLIYYGDEMVNGATLTFPGEKAMSKLYCQMPNMASKYKLWWLLDNDGAYQKQSNRHILNVTTELSMAMVKQLQKQNKIELICMALDEFKEMSTTHVTFLSVMLNKPDVSAKASNFNIIIIMLLVFTAIVIIAIVTIGALIFTLMRRRKSNLKRENAESQSEPETQPLQVMNSNEASQASKA